MTLLKATLAIAAHDKLGEGPVWDQAAQRLLWADHVGEVIHEAKWETEGGWKESRRWTLHRHLAATIPRKQGGLIVVSASDIVMMDDTGSTTPFVKFNFDPRMVRFNDAKCDPQGRLWAGTLGLDFTPRGALYRIDPDGSIATVLEGVTLSNGLDWSPDGSTFYYVDTLSMGIDAFDFDAGEGTIQNRRTIVKLESGAGGANGITVDREGGIWLALTGGGEVRRYLPDGTLSARIQISVPGATSCAFGGENLDQLFITSRSGRMPDVAAKLGVRDDMMEGSGPEAGRIVRMPARTERNSCHGICRLRGAMGPRKLSDCHSIMDVRALAARRLPSPIFHYLDGAADDEVTARDHTAAFERKTDPSLFDRRCQGVDRNAHPRSRISWPVFCSLPVPRVFIMPKVSSRSLALPRKPAPFTPCRPCPPTALKMSRPRVPARKCSSCTSSRIVA